MWSSLLYQVRDKFNDLRVQGWDSIVPAEQPQRKQVIELYDRLTWEMVEGLSSLFLNMIANQNYVAKRLPSMDTRIYQQAHVTMMERVEECISEDIETLLQFYVSLRGLVDQFHGYCRLLKQDISYNYHRYPYLQKDRKFRQINLTLKENLTGFARFRDHCDDLLQKIGMEDAENLLTKIEGQEEDLLDLLEESGFSEEEQALLKKMVEEEEGE